MAEDNYKKLAKVLDTLPNGFPETESKVEIKLLKKIFSPEQAELFCDLRLKFETPEQVAERTGRPLDGLAEQLEEMWRKGQVFGVDFGEVKLYKMVPFVFGIYEFQLKRLDKELAEMFEEYIPVFGKILFGHRPQLMQVVPIEKEIKNNQESLPYEQVSSIIENGQSFAVNECICKKEQKILGHGCDKPLEVCLAIAPVPGIFENHPLGARPISKEEAYDVLKTAEEAGLVHLTSNVAGGHYYICNCCGCCCGVLRSINEFGIADAVNSHYYAEIDEESCVACGTCADERCQVGAIEEESGVYKVLTERCIGCGLCVSTCPSDAITLLRKNEEDCEAPAVDEDQWFIARGKERGVDFSAYQ